MAYTNMTCEVGDKYLEGKRIVIPCSNIKIYEGSVVFANASGKCVYTAAEGLPYLGVACQTCDNSNNENKSVIIATEGVFEFTSSSLTDASLGKTAYLDTSKNPNTITTTKPTTSGALIVPIGKIVRVDSTTKCMVSITYALNTDVTKA